MSTKSLSIIAAQAASSLIAMREALSKAEEHKETINGFIVELFKAKAVVGRMGKNPCAIAFAFCDTLSTAGLAKGTIANYLSVFREHVKTGKPVTDWNPNRAGGKGKAKGQGKAKGSKGFDELLAAVFNHDGGKTLKEHCAEWDKQIITDDAEFDGIYECIASYLVSEGYELAE